MTDQVTSIEQSKRLIELGVPAEKASMIYQSHFTQGVPKLYAQPYQRNGYPPKEKIREDVAPAFTVADLQELLPVFIDAKGTFYLNISKCYEGWYVSYETESGAELISHRGIKLVDVLMDATEWLLSNGYKLNI